MLRGDTVQVKHECHIGMLEIYNESITDLLCPEWTNLQIREDASQGTHVENLSQRRVHAGLALTLWCLGLFYTGVPLVEYSRAEQNFDSRAEQNFDVVTHCI